MDLKNLVWTVENKVGLVVSDYEADQNIVSFMVDTTAADPIVQIADLIDETVRGQVVVIERFDGTGATCFSVENPVISVVTTADGRYLYHIMIDIDYNRKECSISQVCSRCSNNRRGYTI